MTHWTRTALAAAIVALIAAFAVPTAQAQPKRERDRVAKARKHYDRAVELEGAGRYAKAAAAYLEAHSLYPDPEFYFNAAQMYRLDGELRRARAYYRRYLKAEPDGRANVEARRHLADIEEELAAGERDDEGEGEGEGESEGERDVGDRGSGDLDTRRDTGGGSSGSRLRLAGIGAMLVGAAAISVGVKFGLDAREASDELSANAGAWTDELLARQDQGVRDERRFLLAGGVGAAALALGVVLYVKGSRAESPSAARMSLAPVVAPHAAGVTARLAF